MYYYAFSEIKVSLLLNNPIIAQLSKLCLNYKNFKVIISEGWKSSLFCICIKYPVMRNKVQRIAITNVMTTFNFLKYFVIYILEYNAVLTL